MQSHGLKCFKHKGKRSKNAFFVLCNISNHNAIATWENSATTGN